VPCPIQTMPVKTSTAPTIRLATITQLTTHRPPRPVSPDQRRPETLESL
jgi:hypothetical protein